MPTNKITDDGLKTDTSKAQSCSSPAAKNNAVPAAAPVEHAENYDEALPGVPGPDSSVRDQIKPPFNRGMSMLDYTAVASAGPTPANEIPNPLSSHMRGSRVRESHLPDQIESMRRQTVIERDTGLPRRKPSNEIQETDEFRPSLSRQEMGRDG